MFTGASDIGQGSTTIVAMAAAEILNIDLGRVRVITNDSAITPKDNGSYSSRVTFMVGNAAIEAATRLRDIMVNAAALKLEADPADIVCEAETFSVRGGEQSMMSFADVAIAALADDGYDHRQGNLHLPARGAGRQAPGWRGRIDHGLQLCRAGCRGGR